MSKAASQSQMKQLHEQLATTLTAILQARDDNGNPLATASMLNVTRQFLSDNDIEADSGDPQNRDENLENLKQNASVLPFPEAGGE